MPLVRLAEEDEPQPNLAPMIDVILVLTIFFMCATRFSGDEHSLDVELPAAATAAPISSGRPEVVEVAADGAVRLRGEVVPIDELAGRLDGLRTGGAAASVLVRGDRAASHGRMAQVYEACRKAHVRHVGISVHLEAPKRR